METGRGVQAIYRLRIQQDFGKWCARIGGWMGAPIALAGRKKLRFSVTGIDENTASDALLMAMAAVDAGTFSAVIRVHRGEILAVSRSSTADRP